MSQSDFVSRGQALVAAGQFQEAVKVCRLGLLGRPTTVEGRVVLGSALLALKRFDEVLAEMRVALELDHSAVPAHALKAEALLKKGDLQAAIEALGEAQKLAPGDARILQLLGEAQNGPRLPRAPSNRAGVGFIGSGDTKHYPGHNSGDPDDTSEPDASDNFTKPTSLSSPGAPRRNSSQRSAEQNAPKEPTPSPALLAVGDKSGTVEVDPELEGVELDDDQDFDDLAAPPSATPLPQLAANKARGVVMPAAKPAAAKPAAAKPAAAKAAMVPKPAGAKAGLPKPSGAVSKQQPRPAHVPLDEPGLPRRGSAPAGGVVDKRAPTLDLEVGDDSDVLEVDETDARIKSDPRLDRKPGAGTAVRNAVQMPSGPIDIASGPPLGPQPLVSLPRGPLAAALPTLAAMPAQPMPPQRPNVAPQSPFAQTIMPPAIMPPAQRQTMIAAPQPLPPGLFPPPQDHAGPPPNWGAPVPDPRSLAAAAEPTARPSTPPMDPALQAMLAGIPNDQEPVAETPPHKRTGVRKTRSKLQIAMWILIGIIVIGGGVFAGFQIRALRLKKQIAAARTNAMELAKFDTYSGWAAAREELSRILHASGTPANLASLARARALIAFEFDEGVDDAKVTVEALVDKTSLDATIAAAYLALAQSDAKAARAAANAALSAAPQDAGANYVASQAALLNGDFTTAIKAGKAAVDKEPRLLYQVGLARGYIATTNWEEALAALDRALGVMADQPAALIARAIVAAQSGKVTTDPKLKDARMQLGRVVSEATKPTAQISPAQVAFAELALAQLDYVHNDVSTTNADIKAAVDTKLDDQRFVEEVVDTLFAVDQLAHAQNVVKQALPRFKSPRLRIAAARIALAQGNASEALATLKDLAELDKLPVALAVRGAAKLSTGDVEGARADLELAQKAAPKLEAALVGRAWVELAANDDPDIAKKQLGELAGDRPGAPAAVVTVNAAILRRDPSTRDKAKALLEALVDGPPTPELGRAHLELARVYHDLGDFAHARSQYAAASATGSFAARLESGLLLIEDQDPKGGRETLDALLVQAGEHPPAELVLETARARMLVGDHTGAATLLATADSIPNVAKWKVLRERGRLELRRSDIKAALTDLGSALEGCGGDAETFLLAADAASADDKSGLTDKIKTLLPTRLKGQAEAKIVTGKLALAAAKIPDAEAAYSGARDQLLAEKAAPRRVAQANYGLAVVAYQKQHDAEAMEDLKAVVRDDPSIYDAYLFLADLTKNPAAAYASAKVAVVYNGDYPRAWHVLGKLAAKTGDKPALADAIGKLQTLAPGSPELAELQKLKK